MSSTMKNMPVPASAQRGGATPEPATDTSTTRVYRGRSIEELIPKIQAELGNDAIVVRQKEGLAGGVGGFFQRPFHEIEARCGHTRVDLYDEPDAAPAMPQARAEGVDPQRGTLLAMGPTAPA